MRQAITRRVLLRFDDICPTMRWDIWNQVEKVLVRTGVKPIVAVVPDNQDPDLIFDSPDAEFWNRVRTWQENGWTVGLHGYQHLYVTKAAGMFGRMPRSEFAGLPSDQQEAKLRSAVQIFREHNVVPEVWVAPAHSFDTNTLTALTNVGIRTVSDGYALYPYQDSRGTIWIPQQVGRFRNLPFGVWTVCHHINDWTSREVAQFDHDLSNFTGHFTSMPDVLKVYSRRRRSWLDLGAAGLLTLGRRAGRIVRENLRRRSLAPQAKQVCDLTEPRKSS